MMILYKKSKPSVFWTVHTIDNGDTWRIVTKSMSGKVVSDSVCPKKQGSKA